MWSGRLGATARLSYHRRMTNTTPHLTIPCPAAAELRVRVDILKKVLTWLVGGTRHRRCLRKAIIGVSSVRASLAC